MQGPDPHLRAGRPTSMNIWFGACNLTKLGLRLRPSHLFLGTSSPFRRRPRLYLSIYEFLYMLIPHLDLAPLPRPGHLSSTHLSPGSIGASRAPGQPHGQPASRIAANCTISAKTPTAGRGRARESRNTLWGTLAARSSGKLPKQAHSVTSPSSRPSSIKTR